MIARAIHKRSRRSSHAFVSVNCAAIPPSLIASELFGHERGAFTGALQRRLGRFELADEGTLFLDEVGELPAETQITLLRVLRSGNLSGWVAISLSALTCGSSPPPIVTWSLPSPQVHFVATCFTVSMFFRLRFHPCGKDIPLLVEYFIGHFARKAGKSFLGINKQTLDLLLTYPWPGNILGPGLLRDFVLDLKWITWDVTAKER